MPQPVTSEGLETKAPLVFLFFFLLLEKEIASVITVGLGLFVEYIKLAHTHN